MTEFSPLSSFLGGTLIGLAALIMMAAHGRIAGVSGILSRWLTSRNSSSGVNTAFLAGLLLGLPVITLLTDIRPTLHVDSPFIVMLIAGLLVGYGTVSGNGCTSGHGVCGLARFSKRSAIATAIFLFSGIVTTFFVRHVFGS